VNFPAKSFCCWSNPPDFPAKIQMPLLQIGAAIMDTDRMIPHSRSSMSQNGSSPGSGQSSGGVPTYHNASAASTSSNIHQNSGTGLVVNSIARKKKTERMVPPVIPSHSALVNGNNGGIIGTGGYFHSPSTDVYNNHMNSSAGGGGGGGMTNHAYSRDNIR
jgi:hypothetical protein